MHENQCSQETNTTKKAEIQLYKPG